jgi:hypothetical protein
VRTGHDLGRYMPKEIEAWKSSHTVSSIKDFQRSWYDELLMSGWANPEMPCHLPNDYDWLWLAARAHRKDYFLAHCGPVLRQFSECGNGQWVCNRNSLERYLKVLASYFSRGKPSNPQRRNAFHFISLCSCISEEQKQQLLGMKKQDPEPLLFPEMATNTTSAEVWSYELRKVSPGEWERLRSLAERQLFDSGRVRSGQEKMAWFRGIVDQEMYELSTAVGGD